jgi:hypothetical protein
MTWLIQARLHRLSHVTRSRTERAAVLRPDPTGTADGTAFQPALAATPRPSHLRVRIGALLAPPNPH